MKNTTKFWLCVIVLFTVTGCFWFANDREYVRESIKQKAEFEMNRLRDSNTHYDGFSVSPPCPQKRVVDIINGVTNTVIRGSGTNWFADDDVIVRINYVGAIDSIYFMDDDSVINGHYPILTEEMATNSVIGIGSMVFWMDNEEDSQ